ncbi:helix-turn-helix transcriptional regulator [Novosphingobium sp. PP1Y]|uniref:ArsR/SmtB family transcription factor n=1 Tax=Novosphingobium sp. PP1Y TaxID=702113 RepID=UPI00020EE75D|nr:metalloregulator ArsR/SmtB family transcription factor [Novosphingobium sp. PP1Y]CCA91158.1 ArsR family transcriptional regulator [Novosphingobium sp. PP1Y]
MAGEPPIDLLKAIAHPLRYAILAAVAEGERNVGEIEAMTGIGQPTLSQQLSVLRQAGLVTSRREAKLVFYGLEQGAMAQARDSLSALVGSDEALSVAARAREGAIRRSGGAAVFARLA